MYSLGSSPAEGKTQQYQYTRREWKEDASSTDNVVNHSPRSSFPSLPRVRRRIVEGLHVAVIPCKRTIAQERIESIVSVYYHTHHVAP
jgi:hypothetical protein